MYSADAAGKHRTPGCMLAARFSGRKMNQHLDQERCVESDTKQVLGVYC